MSTGARREVARTIEVDPGILPYHPAFRVLRTTGGKGIVMTRDKLDNPEFRADRARVSLRLGNRKVSASFPFAWIFGEHDLELASSFYSVWRHKVGAAAVLWQTVAGTVTTDTVHRNSGSWITDGFRVGDLVAVRGLTTAANKKLWPIAAMDSDDLTLTGLTAEGTTSFTVRVADPKAAYAFNVASVDATSAGTITRGTGSWLDDGVAAGDTVVLSGMATPAHNDPAGYVVASVDEDDLVLTGLGADAATSCRVRQKQFLRDGVDPLTFTLEERQTDITVGGFKTAGGQLVNQLALSLKINALATGQFDYLGTEFGRPTSASVANSNIAAGSKQPLDTFTGSLEEGGSLLALVAGVDLTINNGGEAKFALFDADALQIDPDDCMVSGTLQAYFKDKTLQDKFIDESDSTLYFRNVDLDGNAYETFMPRIRYTGADPNVTKKDVTFSYPFEALQDATYLYHIQISRTPA